MSQENGERFVDKAGVVGYGLMGSNDGFALGVAYGAGVARGASYSDGFALGVAYGTFVFLEALKEAVDSFQKALDKMDRLLEG